MSGADFRDVVWPVLRLMWGGEVRSVELGEDELHGDLDRLAGIDWYHYHARGVGHVRGIASRVEWKYKPDRYGNLDPSKWAHWKAPPNNFTVRTRTAGGSRNTEYARMILSLSESGIYPSVMLHAYLEAPGGPLLALGVTGVKDLAEHMVAEEEAGRPWFERVNGEDGALFTCVYWRKYHCWRYGKDAFARDGDS